MHGVNIFNKTCYTSMHIMIETNGNFTNFADGWIVIILNSLRVG